MQSITNMLRCHVSPALHDPSKYFYAAGADVSVLIESEAGHVLSEPLAPMSKRNYTLSDSI